MKALLIAGGFGTRMRPLTFTRPKHLLPIANKPHIDHVLDRLQRHGVDECVLLTSYLAEAFADTVLSARERGFTVEVAHEETPLGTAGALKNAAELIGSETFFALNGDVLTDADLTELLSFHRERGAEGTILLTPVEDPTQFGVVPTTEEGTVEAFIEKPAPGEAPTNMINAGVYVLEPSVLDRIPAGEEYSAERQLFPGLVEDRVLFAFPTDAYWLDVGTPEKYLQANMDALHGRYVVDEISLRAEGNSVVGDGSEVDGSATISSSAVGAGARIEPDAKIEGSVLLPGVRVGSGAIVIDSILGAGVTIQPGARVEGATIADDEKIGRD
jgi:mannose-1-phosphate guanylyltransferase